VERRDDFFGVRTARAIGIRSGTDDMPVISTVEGGHDGGGLLIGQRQRPVDVIAEELQGQVHAGLYRDGCCWLARV
jgi:hypothetical protein